MFRRYFYTTYRNEICVTIFDINVVTNYIFVNLKYENCRLNYFIKYPSFIKKILKMRIISKEYTNIIKTPPYKIQTFQFNNNKKHN